jgi:hypothetical protein
MTPPEFKGFPKITRLNREIVITEKIDGTNAQISITEDGQIFAGSRKRYLTLENDNHGFAAWVHEHQDELRQLGPGRHYGEWWGQGINRGYGLKEKRFSLFNVERWIDDSGQLACPACCHIVPVLRVDTTFNSACVHDTLSMLCEHGSLAAPGFMNPEGIVVCHVKSRHLYKITLENDDKPKGQKDV